MGWVKALLHSVYDQPDAASVHSQFDRVLDALHGKLPVVADHLDAARADLLAFTIFPREIWRQIWSNNPNERLNREIRVRSHGKAKPVRAGGDENRKGNGLRCGHLQACTPQRLPQIAEEGGSRTLPSTWDERPFDRCLSGRVLAGCGLRRQQRWPPPGWASGPEFLVDVGRPAKDVTLSRWIGYFGVGDSYACFVRGLLRQGRPTLVSFSTRQAAWMAANPITASAEDWSDRPLSSSRSMWCAVSSLAVNAAISSGER